MKSVSLSPFQCPLQSCLMVGLSCQGMMLPGHFWHHLYNKKTIKDRLSFLSLPFLITLKVSEPTGF